MSVLSSVRDNIVLRLTLYYAALALVAWAVWRFLPGVAHQQVDESLQLLLGAAPGAGIASQSAAGSAVPPPAVALMAVIGSSAALLLTLPLAWVYMFTRQKKGYQQSVVHSLILLPVVVALVAALVRNSVALAFSLAGVVAAVRFRTTLDDSKDAVFVFACMALGLACGVQLEVAAVLSVLFVIVVLGLWYTDFGRTPPALEGARAEQHMQRAIAIANRTSQFVAKLDKEILDSMAPAQLQALQARLDKRRSKLEGKTSEHEGGGGGGEEGPRFDGRLTITVSDPDEAQPAIEALLEANLKRWKMVRSDRMDGQGLMVYAVRPKKGVTLETVAEVLQRDGAPFVAHVEAERWA